MKLNQKEPVYIIIPVHNRKNITLKCLETLKQCGDLDRYYTVVVDDGSTDGTSEAITNLYPEVTILTGDGNLWWTGAIKKGMEYAYQQGADYFIWLNDDCLVSNNTISELLKFSYQNNYTIIGVQGYRLDNLEVIAFGGKKETINGYKYINNKNKEIQSCQLLSGNLVCLPKSIITKIGFPDDITVPHYGGDSLYLIKARNKGFKLFVDSRNICFDIGQVSYLDTGKWLVKKGEPLDIIKLIFIKKSLLSWRVWFNLEKEDHPVFFGLVFFYRYIIRMLIPLFIVSLLRYLPLAIRYKISNMKRKMALLGWL